MEDIKYTLITRRLFRSLWFTLFFFCYWGILSYELSGSNPLQNQMLQPTTTAPAWNYVMTGNNHTVYIPATAYISAGGYAISSGDYIGVFYDSAGTLKCGGYIKWLGNTNAITAWGAASGIINGFQSNELIKWKIWRLDNNLEYTVQAIYNTNICYFPNSGNYLTNGLSGIIALSDINPAAVLISGINASYCTNSAIVSLSGSPAGGTFSGPGVTGNQFNPFVAGPGIHNINYSYTDTWGHTYLQMKCVTVNDLPYPSLGADLNVCYGQSTILNAGSFQSYLWSTGATTQSINVGSAGAYSVSVTGTNGCSNTDTINIDTYSDEQVSLGTDITLCQGQSAVLNAGNYVSYSWSNGSTGQTISVTLTGTYSVTATDMNGCSTTDAINVNFNNAPVSSFSVPSSAYVNGAIAVHYTGASLSNAQYVWNFYDASVISGTGQGPYYIQWATTGLKSISLSVTESGCSSTETVNSVSILQDMTFSGISAGLPGVSSSSAAWGDFDNDNDPDLIITGGSTAGFVSEIYRNDGNNVFTLISAGFTGVSGGNVSLNDFDKDNDVDIFITGNSNSGYISSLYRNDGNMIFSLISVGIPGIWHGSSSWADYDNDGDQDVLISGTASSGNISRIYRNNGNSTFTDISAGLSALSNTSCSWGDYDNDGDFDILISGLDNSSNPVSIIYRNDNGIFINISAGLAGVSHGSAKWGDYDSDGDMDVLLTGNNGTTQVSKIYSNISNIFTDINAGLAGLSDSYASWGDFDNDGDPDVLLTGSNSTSSYTKLYRNNNGIFNEFSSTINGVSGGCGLFSDCDSDGDLDIFIAGNSGTGGISGLFINNGSIFNSVPAIPTGTSSQITGNIVTLNWNMSTDNQTPQNGLMYNIRIGTSAGGSGVKSPMANISSGYLKTISMGNCQLVNSYQVKSLPYGTIYWSVQAIDNTFAGSAFTAESVFTYLPSSLFTLPSGTCVSAGTTITYTGNASPLASYSWSFEGGTIISGSGQGPYQVSWAESGNKTVSLTVTDNGYTSSTTNAIILVSPAAVGGTVTGGSSKCLGSSTGNLTLTGYTGIITKWQKRINPGTWINIGNTAAIYVEIPSSPGAWEYRTEVQSGTCTIVYSSITTVIVSPLSVGGTVSGGGTICLGSSTGTMSLSGNTGTINRWQKRVNYGSWSNISNPSLNYSESPTATGTWQYRAEVKSGACSVAYSTPATVTVNPGSVGGSVTGGSTICYGTPTGTLTLSGYTGVITKWQKSYNSGVWNDIVNTNTTWSEIPASTGTWDYRAEVQNGSCNAVYSASTSVFVIPASSGGSISGGSDICVGSSTAILTLSGYTGSIQKWQNRLNGGSWTDITNTSATFSEIPLSSGIWDYQALVQNSSCSPVYSATATVNVSPNSVGGTVSGGISVCLGNSTGTLTLSDFTGTINKWQKRLDDGSWDDIINTAGFFTDTPASAGTWDYRAEVQNGTCSPEYSAFTSVIVESLSEGGSVSGGTTVCFGNSTGILTLTGYNGNIIKWQKMHDSGDWFDLSNTGYVYSETPSYTGEWRYRVLVQNSLCEPAFSAEAIVIVIPLPLINLDDTISFVSGDTAIIDAGDGFQSYIWQDGLTTQSINVTQSGIYYLTVTDVSGCQASAQIVAYEIIYSVQNVELISGWSIISTYIIPVDTLISDVFSSVVSTLVLVKDEFGQVFWPAFDINLIGNITTGDAYQILMQSAQIMQVTGIAVIPENTPLYLLQGWSLVGYLRQSPGSLVQMLGSLSQLILLKDCYGNVYWPLFQIDMIEILYPGKGYQIYMASSQVLIYPPNSLNND